MIVPTIKKLFGIAFVLACVGSITGFAGHWLWSFDLASHFRSHYFVFLSGCAVIFITTKLYYRAAFAAAIALVNLLFLLPMYQSETVNGGNTQGLRIISANVYAENREHSQLNDLVHDSNPDFLALFEVDQSWLGVTEQLKQRFKYARVEEKHGYFGIALFSQYPINRVEFKKFGHFSQYAIIAHLEVDGRAFHIIAAHVLAPTSQSYFDLRNKHLRNLAKTARALEGPVMLIGDLNITPWSPYFEDLVRESKLLDGSKGFGLQPTWPVQLSFIGIPIDHCLVSPSVEIQQWSRGPDIGSDHFPIIVDFSIQKANHQFGLARLKPQQSEDQLVN